ncbi:MAG: Holliday junction resolvase RuvX, partial [Anaerovoracaceae bacterium]
KKMRIMSLDVGDVRIGVAISDPLLITAQGLCTIERVGIRKDAGKILDLIDEYDVKKVVIGLPINLDGSNSAQTNKTIEFADMLKNKMKSTGKSKITCEFEDERFTSKMAESVLIQGNVRRMDRKNVIDKQAAIIILQSYLDKH